MRDNEQIQITPEESCKIAGNTTRTRERTWQWERHSQPTTWLLTTLRRKNFRLCHRKRNS
jgi:hypothetical protein